MAIHLTPTELARESGLERREVIVKCMELGVPIFQGRIDKTLFLASLDESALAEAPRSAPRSAAHPLREPAYFLLVPRQGGELMEAAAPPVDDRLEDDRRPASVGLRRCTATHAFARHKVDGEWQRRHATPRSGRSSARSASA